MSTRRWLAPASAVAVVAVAVGAWAVLHGGTRAGPARTTSATPSTQEFLTGRGSQVVTFDQGVDQVLTAVGHGPQACTDEARRLGTTYDPPRLAATIQAVPDPRLGEMLIDEDTLVGASLAACANGDPATGSYASQLGVVHAAAHRLLVSAGVERG